jgi:4-hydroxybenzoate polyprenyltransferase
MFVYELVKTVRDEAADRFAGVKTVATCWSTRGSIVLCRLSAGVAGIVSLGVGVMSDNGALYFGIMACGVVLPTAFAVRMIRVNAREGVAAAARAAQRVMTLTWVPGLVGLAVI